jgi:hypothetical protein
VLTEEGGALLNEHTGRWTGLTPTAAAAVMLLLANDSDEQAAAQYAGRYGIDVQQAGRDIQAVADTLSASGVVLNQPAPGRRGWRWWQ